MKLIPGILTIILSVAIGTYALDIFMAFAHTDYTYEVVCSESVSISVPANVKAEYLSECNKVTANIESGYNIAFGNSFIIGLLALLLFALGCFEVIYQRGKLNA